VEAGPGIEFCEKPSVAGVGYLRKIFESRGVTFHLSVTLTSFSGRRGGVTARFTAGPTR